MILSLAPYFHDSSITVLDDKKIHFAVEEERLERYKHSSRGAYSTGLPIFSLKYLWKNTLYLQ